MYSLIDEWIHHILPMIPFFVLYFSFMEFISHFHISFSLKQPFFILLFVILVSSIPQCSITILMVYLFFYHKISFGTLVASFIAMNDESILLLLGTNHQIYLSRYLFIKIICALITGLVLDKCVHIDYFKISSFTYNHHHSSLISAVFLHTFQIVFILSVVLVLEEIIFDIIDVNYLLSIFSHSFISRIILMLIGLIPGCSGPFLAYSLLNSQFISFSVYSCVLTTCNGFGLVVLFKNYCTKYIFIIIISLLCNALFISFLCEVLI